MKKALYVLLIGLILLFFLIWWKWPDDKLHVVMCDVGQGDAILINLHFHQLLIDTGPSDAVLDCLGEFMPFWDRNIEVIVLTHDDADHAAGIKSIVTSYKVGVIFRNPPWEPTELSKAIEEIIKKYQIETHTLTQGKKITIENGETDVTFLSIWPEVEDISVFKKTEQEQDPNRMVKNKGKKNDNDLSVSGYVGYGEFRMLSAGDISSEIELSLTREHVIKDIDVIKVSHHGSKNSTHEEFIMASRPETALMGVGKNNSFGHPHTRVIDILRYRNIKIYTTSQHGHIEIISDGRGYEVKPSREK